MSTELPTDAIRQMIDNNLDDAVVFKEIILSLTGLTDSRMSAQL